MPKAEDKWIKLEPIIEPVVQNQGLYSQGQLPSLEQQAQIVPQAGQASLVPFLPSGLPESYRAQFEALNAQKEKKIQSAPSSKANLKEKLALTLLAGPLGPMLANEFAAAKNRNSIAQAESEYLNNLKVLAELINKTQGTAEGFGVARGAAAKGVKGIGPDTILPSAFATHMVDGVTNAQNTPFVASMIQQAGREGVGSGLQELINLGVKFPNAQMPKRPIMSAPIDGTASRMEEIIKNPMAGLETGQTSGQSSTFEASASDGPKLPDYMSSSATTALYNALTQGQALSGRADQLAVVPSQIGENNARAYSSRQMGNLRGQQAQWVAPQARAKIQEAGARTGLLGAQTRQTQVETNQMQELQPYNIQEKIASIEGKQQANLAQKAALAPIKQALSVYADQLIQAGIMNKTTGVINDKAANTLSKKQLLYGYFNYAGQVNEMLNNGPSGPSQNPEGKSFSHLWRK